MAEEKEAWEEEEEEEEKEDEVEEAKEEEEEEGEEWRNEKEEDKNGVVQRKEMVALDTLIRQDFVQNLSDLIRISQCQITISFSARLDSTVHSS